MANPTVSYSPRPDISTEAELDTLAGVYRFILDCHAKKKAAVGTGGHEEKGTRHDLPVSTSLLCR